MKAVRIELAGRTRYLCFTVEGMFQLQDKFGGVLELLEAIQGDTREAFTAATEAAAILAEQGELTRRSLGYEAEPIVDADTLAATTAPSGLPALKLAIPKAIELGYGREIQNENDEIDLGLAELNRQKKTR